MTYFKKLVKKLKQMLQSKVMYVPYGLIAYYLIRRLNKQKQYQNVQLSYFVIALSKNLIKEVFICGKTLIFKSEGSGELYKTYASVLSKDQLFTLLKDQPNLTYSCVEEENKELDLPQKLLILGASAYLSFYITQKIFQPQQIQPLDEEFKSKVKFSDIYGLEKPKEQLQEIIDYLQHPQKYQKVGARLRKGILIHGPPGTGKTMLAKATAGESRAYFIHTTASEFVEMYVGVGAKKVRELFNQAKKYQPCIIFIDEIDGIGQRNKNRRGDQEQASDMERTTTLNQLLTEMDGFQEIVNIVVIAATNRIQFIDEALLRSGRFDSKISVCLPNLQERKGILNIHLKNKQHNVTDNALEEIAQNTKDFSGADLENIINESAYCCIHHERELIEDGDLYEAFQKVFKEKN